MSTRTIPLSEEAEERLAELAESTGLSADEFLQSRIEAMLLCHDPVYTKASEYLLTKNAELYRRLA